jgi:prolyl-tRNA synthetase
LAGNREQPAEFVREVTPQGQDFSQWYTDVVLKAELADYGPVKGTIVIRPAGQALWERIQAGLDRRFKATGVENASFPLLIPESFMKREAEHVEGFAPEVAWVTEGGGEKLTERLAIRPTSETVICSMYARWIHSYRDLPVLINQWGNVVRWERATRPFLRTTEFWWQEGHTAHATEAEAHEEALRMAEVYREFIESEMAVPVLTGRKSDREKFAGAVATYSCEALMGDGRALQAATSHELGTHFAEVFGIRFLDRDGVEKPVWQTSWGASTRLIGALIMVHGDDRGLVLPPRLAPIQVIVVPIAPAKEREAVLTRVRQLRPALEELYRVKVDDREEYTPGWKFNEWEMRGVPLRLEVGPRDVKAGQAVLARRDSGERVTVAQEDLPRTIGELLGQIQDNLLSRARDRMKEATRQVSSLADLVAGMGERRGLFVAGWCGRAACEERVAEESGATLRVLNADGEMPPRCLVCGEPSRHRGVFARAY